MTPNFHTDKQTLEELNLLGKFRQGSIYRLFNGVRTTGGERVLNQMFTSPLRDADAINARSETFQFFQHAGLEFPFDPQQVALMRDYLDGTGGNGMLTGLADLLVKKGLFVLMHDERYMKAIQGVQATILVLNRCRTFVGKLEKVPTPYAAQVKTIRSLLGERQLEKLLDTDIYRPLPIRLLAFYNYLLKRSLHQEMQALLDFIHELDVYIAVGNVAGKKGLSYANALPAETNRFFAKALRHPAIDGAIGNDITLDENGNILFLTGANMAGKSTLMKAIGIGIYLAHMGFPVAANGLEFSVRDGLYTSINVADNMNMGYSHFYAEVMRVKQAAEATASGQRLMLMFDELFKGTNVKDAYDGTLAITQAFADFNDCLFIVSTHIIEVGEALKDHKRIRFAYMPTIMDGLYPRYTYRLTEGITEDRQGMIIIRNEGILELLEDS